MSAEISQIKSQSDVDGLNEVPPGYKRTEVGVIPEDWEEKKLVELGLIVRGGSPRPAGDPRFFNGKFIPWLTVAAITSVSESQINITETAGCLTEEGANHSRILLPNTLIVANSGATLGIAKVLQIKCCANDGIAAIIDMRVGNKSFLCYFINTKTQHLREVVATGNGQPNLNTALIGQIIVPFPPLPEQQAIVETLSDVDGLITSLDKLIAKKQAIKQATMQQLLTGKTRLPGFSGEWERKRLGDYMRFQVGFPFSSTYFNSQSEGLRIVKNRDLKAEDDITFYSGAYDPIFKVNNDNILVGMDGDFILCRWKKGIALLNQRVGRILPSTGLNPIFAYYALAKPLRKIERMTSATTVKHLSHGNVASIHIFLPEIEEQTAIATILSDIDTAINALEKQRDKTKKIKQGMMQQLLTGRIRLITPEE